MTNEFFVSHATGIWKVEYHWRGDGYAEYRIEDPYGYTISSWIDDVHQSEWYGISPRRTLFEVIRRVPKRDYVPLEMIKSISLDHINYIASSRGWIDSP